MTADWARGLLRDRGSPQRATYLEIFFDLVFVLALALISQMLATEPSPGSVLHAAVSLLAIWWVWILTALMTTIYDPHSRPLQAITVAIMVGTALMATAIPDSFGDRGLIFAGAYVTIHLGRGVFFALALRGGPARDRAMRIWFWFAVSAVPWLVGAVLTGWARPLLWGIALAVDYTALALSFPVPCWRAVPSGYLTPTSEHLAERYHQFFAIALGDIILLGGLLYSRGDHSLLHAAAFLSGFASALLLWRIYTHCAGEMLHRALAVSPTPSRFAQSAPYTHLFMVAGVVVTGASAEVIISDPGGRALWSEIALIFGGPALFLLGRARFDYEVFGHTGRVLLTGVVPLVLLAPAMRLLPPVLVGVIANLVLAGIVAFDFLTRHRTEQTRPAPPPL